MKIAYDLRKLYIAMLSNRWLARKVTKRKNIIKVYNYDNTFIAMFAISWEQNNRLTLVQTSDEIETIWEQYEATTST